MKSRILAVLILCILSVALGLGQTSTNTTSTAPTTSTPVILRARDANLHPDLDQQQQIGKLDSYFRPATV